MLELRLAETHDLGLDASRVAAACRLLESWTEAPSGANDEAPLPGVALVVGRHHQILAPKFFGRQGPEPEAPPLRRDAAFLVASITKPVTNLAAMLLVERGLLSLTEPVVKYVPEFAAHHKDGTLILHLCTHTSGLPDMLDNNAELRREHAPLARFVQCTARDVVPKFAPGANLQYQSMGTLMLAEIVERIVGQPLPEFLEREIFGPLGMSSTSLGARSLDRERIARLRLPAYQQGTDYHWNSEYWRALGAPWGGMFTTPEDFAKLCACLLAGGRAGNRQLFSPATIAHATANRLQDLADLPEPIRRTQPWGIGWRLNHFGSPDTWGDLVGARAFGHLGATGTMTWIDPDTGLYFVLFATAPLEDHQWRFVRISNAIAAARLPE